MSNEEQTKQKVDLAERLQQASVGSKQEQREFFSSLLLSEVFIPQKPIRKLENEMTGEDYANFLTVEMNGRRVIPIFSNKEFAESWFDDEIICSLKPFPSLLRLLGKETWLHLNAGQEFGKELSPWELEILLKAHESQSKEPLEELVEELHEGYSADLEVMRGQELYPEFRSRLVLLFEFYPEVREAFLIAVQNAQDLNPEPVVGLVVDAVTAQRKEQLREEVQASASAANVSQHEVGIVDNLADTKSSQKDSQWNLFQEMTPFYIRKEIFGEQSGRDTEKELASFWSRLAFWRKK